MTYLDREHISSAVLAASCLDRENRPSIKCYIKIDARQLSVDEGSNATVICNGTVRTEMAYGQDIILEGITRWRPCSHWHRVVTYVHACGGSGSPWFKHLLNLLR